MKAWVLADSLNGYTWGWKLYTGKEGDRAQHGLAHDVVMELVADDRLQGMNTSSLRTTSTLVPLCSKPYYSKDSVHVVQCAKTEREYRFMSGILL